MQKSLPYTYWKLAVCAILKIWDKSVGVEETREDTFHCFVSGLFIVSRSFRASDPISLGSDLDKARRTNPQISRNLILILKVSLSSCNPEYQRLSHFCWLRESRCWK